MRKQIRVKIGQHSLAGEHPVNQDFHGAVLPACHRKASKGLALALADGISSSAVSQFASASAVRSFLEDYFLTSEAWTVKRSALCVLSAANAWLHGQGQRGEGRFNKDRGYVCTFSALILKGRDLHLLHVGDSRVYRLHAHSLEQLTEDHRIHLSESESYLARALGTAPQLDIDYKRWEAAVGEIYILATDGAYEHLSVDQIHAALANYPDDWDAAAAQLTQHARDAGSTDDATLQLLRIDELPDDDAPHAQLRRESLMLPPALAPGMRFEGFTIVRALHLSARSHVHLAIDDESGVQVVLKTPSVDLRESPDYLDGFVFEEWVARRISNPHIIKAWPGERPRQYLFVALEYIEGQTLAQWMIDNPRPSLERVRNIVSQVAAGLQAFHGRDMFYRDLRPENVLIDCDGTVRIIDLATVFVAGLAEGSRSVEHTNAPGTVQYMAPECLLGAEATPSTDLFSLAVLCYQMLSGQLPYGLQAVRVRSPQDLRALRYIPLRHHRPELPAWLDGVLGKALQITPEKRQEAVSEFVHDLKSPGPQFQRSMSTPLIERDPVLFWKCSCLLLALAVIVLGSLRLLGR